MSDRVDTLFDGDPDLPTRRSHARFIQALLGVALPLDLIGLVTCTSVPGAGLTLWAWWWIDRELGLIETGALGGADAPRLHVLRRIATAALTWCVVAFAAQIYLLSSGAYERWLLQLEPLLG